ncbi:MAG: threonine synthase [Candidatus Aenigmarchaeota archaeon]|nr:threonine synthase [Candidatus Aenigmarchaeota archaeon]
MINRAYLQCIIPSCGATYDVGQAITECGACGNLLDVAYEHVVPSSFKGTFLGRRNPGNNIFNESGVHRFRESANFTGTDSGKYGEYSKVLVSLDGLEGNTKPVNVTAVARYVGMDPKTLYLQFEGRNPSGSFKDNGMATAFTHGKMVGAETYACASTGNTSASAAQYAANEGKRAFVIVGQDASPTKVAQALYHGAVVFKLEGPFDKAMGLIKKVADEKGVYLVNSVNPFRLEGQKTIIYRMLESLKWNPPDWIVLPFGNGGNTAAFGKALKELYDWGWIKKMPRIAVVNARGANTFYHLYHERGLKWNGGAANDVMIQDYYSRLHKNRVRPRTKASAVAILKPENMKKALRTMEWTNGVAAQVSDIEIMKALGVIGRNGFGAEIASAAAVAGIKQLVEQGIIGRDETVVGVMTGDWWKESKEIMAHEERKGLITVPPNIDVIYRKFDEALRAA